MRFIRAFLLLAVASFSWAQAGETELISVDAVGYGRTTKEAEADALRAAVQKAVGVFVSAETLVKNEDLISDKILTFSNGFVKEYKSETPKKNSQLGLYEVSISAKVFRQKLLAKLDENKISYSVAVSGQNLFAQALTLQNKEEDANKLFDDTVQDLFVRNIDKLFRVRMIDFNGGTDEQFSPEITSLGSNKARIEFFVEVSYDLDYWNNTVVPRWTSVLDQIALSKAEEQTVDLDLEKADGISFPLNLQGKSGVSGQWTPEGDYRLFAGAPERRSIVYPDKIKDGQVYFTLFRSNDQIGESYQVQGYTLKRPKSISSFSGSLQDTEIMNIYVDLVTVKGQVLVSQSLANNYRLTLYANKNVGNGEGPFKKDNNDKFEFDRISSGTGYFMPLFSENFVRHWSQYYVKWVSIDLPLSDIKKISKFVIRKVKA